MTRLKNVPVSSWAWSNMTKASSRFRKKFPENNSRNPARPRSHRHLPSLESFSAVPRESVEGEQHDAQGWRKSPRILVAGCRHGDCRSGPVSGQAHRDFLLSEGWHAVLHQGSDGFFRSRG